MSHYHASDQFQVFMDGDGLLGKHPLRPVSIHYTNKFTGYGPLVAGPQGMTYYVFRPRADPLGPGQYLHRPEALEKVKSYQGKRRTLTAEVGITDSDALQGLINNTVRTLFEVDAAEPDHGTIALEVLVAPGKVYSAPDPATGGGQVLLVLQGEISTPTFSGGARSAMVATTDEPAITVTAGPAGAQLLLMQYPQVDNR